MADGDLPIRSIRPMTAREESLFARIMEGAQPRVELRDDWAFTRWCVVFSALCWVAVVWLLVKAFGG